MEPEIENHTDAMVNYSILMPYYQRADQLSKTLVSYRHHYGDRKDWELVIIQDPKEKPEGIRKVLGKFSNLPIILVAGKNNGRSPAPLYNQGAEWARGKVLILTSPEVYHISDVLGRLDGLLFLGHYYLCSCASATDGYVDQSNGRPPVLRWTPDRWFQHGKYRPASYHFCSVIARADWDRVGGFDEEYKKGIGYDDGDFRNSVILAGIRLLPLDDVLTVHLPHPKDHDNRRHLLEINRIYYERKWADFSLSAYGFVSGPSPRYGLEGEHRASTVK